MTDPARIAEGLTEAQRRCLFVVASERTIEIDDARLAPFLDDAEPSDTFNQCCDLGLMDQFGNPCFDEFYIKALPLGLAVRNHLESNNG